MGRRTKIIKETNESKALKKLRLLTGLSVRKLADKIGVSHTLVSHMELGRANIQDEYIDKFLKALDLSLEDWTVALKGGNKAKAKARNKITKDCMEKVQGLSEDQLILLNSILNGMSL